jgi:hypothetical protein
VWATHVDLAGYRWGYVLAIDLEANWAAPLNALPFGSGSFVAFESNISTAPSASQIFPGVFHPKWGPKKKQKEKQKNKGW